MHIDSETTHRSARRRVAKVVIGLLLALFVVKVVVVALFMGTEADSSEPGAQLTGYSIMADRLRTGEYDLGPDASSAAAMMVDAHGADVGPPVSGEDVQGAVVTAQGARPRLYVTGAGEAEPLHLVVRPQMFTGLGRSMTVALVNRYCTDPQLAQQGSANAIWKQTVSASAVRSNGLDIELPVTLRDLSPDAGVSLLVGTTAPLAPSRCSTVATPIAIVAALQGEVGAFATRCIQPLQLAAGDVSKITSVTFSDERCANDFERLAQFAWIEQYAPSEAQAIRQCARDEDVELVVDERVDAWEYLAGVVDADGEYELGVACQLPQDALQAELRDELEQVPPPPVS